jgi:hypothetical protein
LQLPFGKQFTPEQTPLVALLGLLERHAGDRESLERAIVRTFFSKAPVSQQPKLAMNTYLSLRAYGLVTDECVLSAAGQALIEARGDEQEAHRVLARHILLNCHGLVVLEVVKARMSRGESLTVQLVADDLRSLGMDPGGTRGEKLSSVRGWLAQAGIVSSSWRIDDSALVCVVGLTSDEIEDLKSLPVALRAFLRALASLPAGTTHNSQTVARLADQQSQTRLGIRRDLPTGVLKPLQDAGWLTYEKTTAGRGGKAFTVTPTAAFEQKIATQLADALVGQAELPDPSMLRRPLADLLREVRDPNASKHDRGYALEGVCIQIMRLIGGQFLGWRLRAHKTGGAEVDVLAEFVGGRHDVVLMQSKVAAISGREAVDREVAIGLNQLRCQTIVFVSAGKVGPAARAAADGYMRNTNLAILFFDETDLDAAVGPPEGVLKALHREFDYVRAIRSAARGSLAANGTGH